MPTLPSRPSTFAPAIKQVAYIGIDPGLSNGGLAVILPGNTIIANHMPRTERDTWNWFRYFVDGEGRKYNQAAVIEWINPGMPGTNKSSMSKLYGNYMTLRAFLTSAGIPFEDEKPAKWQRALGISPRTKTETPVQWKNRLKGKAQQLFPQESRITLATADALLIAEYCRRKHTGTL